MNCQELATKCPKYKTSNTMNITPSQLEQNGYMLQDKLDHKELIPFIKEYLNRRGITTFVYYGINLAFLIIAIVMIIWNVEQKVISIGDSIFHFFLGFSIAFLLVGIHEYIHVLAYRMMGAKETSLEMNLKKFYFLALADKFVANRREFVFIALAPFTIISVVFAVLAVVLPFGWSMTMVGVLFALTAMCSGDFGLLGYFEAHIGKEVVTYDDVENKVSYFYSK